MPPGPPPRDGGGVAPHHPEAPSSPTAASEIELQVPGPSRVSTALSELSPPGTVRGQPDRENEGTWKPRRPSLNMLRSGLGRLQTKDGSQKVDKEVEKVNEDEQGQHQTLPQQDKDQTTRHCKLTVLSTVLPPLLPALDVVAIHDIDQSPEAARAYTPHPVFQKGAIDLHMQPVNEEDDELAEDKPDADVYLSFSNAPGSRRKSSLLPGSLNVWTEEEGHAHGHPRDIKEWAFQVPTILQGDVTPSTDPRGAFRDGSSKEKEKMTETIEQLQGDLSPRASMVEQDGRPGHLDANPSASHSGIRTPSETEHKTSRWLTDPTMFAGDFSRSRIMSFSYKPAEMPAHLGSSAMPDFDQYLEETAQSLLDNLLAVFVEENEGTHQPRIPLVLIGVGFGCLIIQKLVSLAATHDMLNMVAGVFFFDVPTPIIAEESADIFPPSPNTNSRWFKSMTGSVPRLIDCGELWQSFRSVAAKQDLSVCWFYRVTANKPIYPQADGVSFEPLIAYPAKSTRTHGRFLGPKDPNYIRFAERTRASLLFKVASDRELEHLLVDLINTSLDGMHTVLMRDCKGRCALHRAASRGNDLAVTRLVSAFPKLAALRDDDGRTALHSVILRAIEVNPEEENQEQYKSIIEKLLSTMIELEEPGQLDDPKDRDSKSPWDYVQEDRHQWIRSLRDRSILFKGARSEHGERLGTITQPVAEKLAVCRKSEAFFFQFYIAKNNSRDWFDRAPSNIYRLLYDPNYGAENIFLRNKRIDPEKKATCRWIHLPANNEEWIQDLFTQLRRVDSSMRGKRHEGTNYYDRYLNPGAERYQQTYEPESGGTNEPPLPTSPMSPMPSTPRTPSFQSNPLTSPTGQRSPKLGEDLRSGHYRSYSGTFPQPSSTSSTDVGSVKKAAIALFMPILGFEEHENRIKLRSAMMTACKESAKRDAMMTPSGGSVKNEAMTPSRALVKDETSMLIRSYFGAKDSPLHCRRTLDQFTYHMLEDTVKRDNTQVIFKWAAKQGEKRAKNPAKQKGLESDRPPQNQDSSQVGHTYPVLMVDQLWLWVLEDDETVITSFSNTWKPNAEFSLFQYLQQDLQNNHSRPLVESGFDLANLIIKSSVDFLRRQGPEKMSLQEGFQASINDIAENQARLFDDFKKLVDKLNDDRLSQKKRARYTNRLFQLTEETDFLADIMDIQDELKTIKDVFLKQKEVLGQFVQLFSKGQQKKSKGQKEKKKGKEHQRKASAELDASAQKQQSPKASRIRELAENNLNSVNANITAVEEMTKYADKIRAELNTLLNLKQKQANVWEARFSREGSEQTQRQGNITMVFTIVTIFFLPLSFMSSFLAIQVDTFPKNAETGEVSWPARQAMVLLFGLSLAIIVPFTLVAFHVNQISAFVGKYVKVMRQSRAPDLPTHKTPEKPLVHDYADPGNDSDSSTGEGSNQSPPWGRKKRKFKHTLPAWRRILPLPGLVRTPSKDGTSWSSSGSSTSIVSRRLFPRHHLYAPLFGRQGWYFHTRIPWVRRWWKFRYYSESLFSTATASSGSSNPMKLEGSSSSSSVSSDSASARRQRWNDRVVRDYPLRRAMERARKVMEQPLASWRKKNKQKDDDDRSEESGSGVERDLMWLANNAEKIARQPAGQLGQQPYSYGTSKGWAAFQPMKKAFTFRKPVAVPRVDLDVDLEKGRPWV